MPSIRQPDNLTALRAEMQLGDVIAEAWESITTSDGKIHVMALRVVSIARGWPDAFRCVRYFMLGDGDYEKWYGRVDHVNATAHEAIFWTADAAYMNVHNQQPQCVAMMEEQS